MNKKREREEKLTLVVTNGRASSGIESPFFNLCSTGSPWTDRLQATNVAASTTSNCLMTAIVDCEMNKRQALHNNTGYFLL